MADYHFRDAFWDIKTAAKNYYLWITLGWYDVLARYRRSTLGPLWITLSMIVTIAAMGPLYGSLFGFDLAEFIPHLALGMIFWIFIATSLNEFCLAYVEAQHYLKQIKIPLSVFVLRVLYRQFIILGHNIIIYPLLLLILWRGIGLNVLWFIPGFLLVLTSLFSMGVVISAFCTRYRDMTPVISSLTQLMFFVTPIIWNIDQLPANRKFLANWNPLGVLLDLVRKPLLGEVPALYNWYVGIAVSAAGLITAYLVLARTCRRVSYWL